MENYIEAEVRDDYPCVLGHKEFDDYCEKLKEELGENFDWFEAAADYCELIGADADAEIMYELGL